MGRYVRFEQTKQDLRIYDTERELWSKYLALDVDYGRINDSILGDMHGDETMRRAMECGDGIRILRQDKWETLCSFIISQNNNIPRIKKIISSLCQALGEQIRAGERVFYSFPTPEKVASAGIEFLTSLKTGFRAKYIYDAAIRFRELPLEDMEHMSFEEADVLLRQIKGVGPKVSSCVLLFAFSHLEAFPVDVWIKRVLQKYYTASPTPLDIRSYGGVAQQYLFYYERYGFSK